MFVRTFIDIQVVVEEMSSGKPTDAELFTLDLLLYIEVASPFSVRSDEAISVTAYNQDIVRSFWTGSAALTADVLKTVVSAQVWTNARDQGWATFPDQGLWSWFEVAILNSPSTKAAFSTSAIKKDASGQPLTWLSHRLPISKDYSEQTGILFGPDHALWKNVSAGNSIAVLACVQYSGWKVDGKSVELILRRPA